MTHSNNPTQAQRLYQLALNPWTIMSCLVAGSVFGLALPETSKALAVIGAMYVDLLKMIVLPFMVSAVIFSLQRLFKEGGAGKVLSRVAWVFISFALIAATVGALGTYPTNIGGDLSPTTRADFGKMVGQDASQNNTEMSLFEADEPIKQVTMRDVMGSLIPSNIFAALAQGEALKALVFALLFGFAIGQVPNKLSDNLTGSLETVYQACQTLTHWLNYLVPFVLFAMSATQMAETGLEPIKAMSSFVVTFMLTSLVLLLLAMFLLRLRSERSWNEVLQAMHAPFALAVATRSSATCMPAMIEALTEKLNFARAKVELLVPLSVSLLRIGPTLYYVVSTLFIAQLYDRTLTLPEVGLVVVMSVIAGFSSAGMSGLVTLTLVGTTCGYLGLPFEAAFILFVAVDPICDIARTVLIVICNSAAVALVCPKPQKESP